MAIIHELVSFRQVYIDVVVVEFHRYLAARFGAGETCHSLGLTFQDLIRWPISCVDVIQIVQSSAFERAFQMYLLPSPHLPVSHLKIDEVSLASNAQ